LTEHQYKEIEMAPKGGNAKKEGGRAKKAENEVRPFHHLKRPSVIPARMQLRLPVGVSPRDVRMTD